MTRYVMVVDLRRCTGCQTCTAACKLANGTPPGVQWRRVLDIESGTYPDVQRTFLPVSCMHCGDPPCLKACPTGATFKYEDGRVGIHYDLCIGCAYCAVACPFQQRFRVMKEEFAYGSEPSPAEARNFDPARMGVSTKCTFCSDRIDLAHRTGRVPGQDPEVTPACVNSCIADALKFGDLNDPDSSVSKLLRESRHFRLHEELGTDPGIYYLYAGEDAQ